MELSDSKLATSSTHPGAELLRLPSLDGWRALSICIVLGSHSKGTYGFPRVLDPAFTWLFDGGLGVRFFFVISGFLITWLMLVENEQNGRVSLYHFYVRRGLRILPVYVCFLSTLFLIQLFTPFHQSLAAWIANLTFTTNFFPVPWTSSHLWSLAVEEQFYVLWPISLVLCNLRKGLRNVIIILALAILFPPLFRVVSYVKYYPLVLHPLFVGNSFFCSCDSLAFGCCFALLFMHQRTLIQELSTDHKWLIAGTGVTLILVPYVLEQFFLAGIFTVPFGNSFQSCGFAILLMQSLARPDLYFYRFLNWNWVRRIGILSYSIYIWQQIFCTSHEAYGIPPVWWLAFPSWLIPVLCVAIISYYLIERPFFRFRAYFRNRPNLRTISRQRSAA